MYGEQIIITALKLAYRKHCLADDSIGWIELEDILKDALCDHMGDDVFYEWLRRWEDGEEV